MALYTVDGHDFDPCGLIGSVECKNCGQQFSEALVSAACSSGLKGVFPTCASLAKTPPYGTPIPFPPPEPPKVTVRKNLCPVCDREMSKYLDAYHGKDPVLKELCRDCRTEREHEQLKYSKQFRWTP